MDGTTTTTSLVESARSILEDVDVPELPSLPEDLKKALCVVCGLLRVVRCVRTADSDYALQNAISLGELYAQGVRILPDQINETETAVTPVLEEIRDATENVVEFGGVSELTAFDVVREFAKQTQSLADFAERINKPFPWSVPKPPAKEWETLRAKLVREARETGSQRLKKAESKEHNSEKQTISEIHEDGPEQPNLLFVNGEKHEIPPIPWRIINHMWNKDSEEESEIVLAVWPDDATGANLRTTINRANNAMAEIPINRKLGMKAGCVYWK